MDEEDAVEGMLTMDRLVSEMLLTILMRSSVKKRLESAVRDKKERTRPKPSLRRILPIYTVGNGQSWATTPYAQGSREGAWE